MAGSRLAGVGRVFPGTGVVEGDGAITLRTAGLTRRFAVRGGIYRLVEAATDVGRARLSYANGRLAAISSGTAKAHLHRRPDGRIVAIEDHLGRAVRYRYDDLGRLEALTDLAGEAWRFAYSPLAAGGSALTRMADPRGHAVLEAAYEEGKVASLRHLAAKANFHYGARTTRVVDGLSRTTTFYHLASGITDAISDPLGRLAQLTLDGDARPTVLRRDGVAVAKLAYDADGRLLAIAVGPAGTGKHAAFSYGPHGLVRAAGDGVDATYSYDAQGRVVGVANAAGQRSYGYDAAGRLHTVAVDGATTELSTDANGATTEVRRDGELVIAYRYRPDGRVAAIDYADAGAAASYRYDKRGFRTEADYSDDVRSKLRYDGAGNLVHYEVRSPKGTTTQDYEIGPRNQLLGIRNGGAESAPSVAFEYDAAGRLLAVAAGQRHATIAHDDLDRVTAIALDGEPLLKYDYDPLATGAIAAADRVTGEVAALPGASAVFGTLDTIVYTRPRPMEHAAIAYDPALKTFVPRSRHLAPDAALRSSLARRSIPVGKAAPGPRPFAADKPSNSLFIPPQFAAVNCRTCSSSIQSATFSAPGRARVGEAVQFTSSVTGSCAEVGLGFYGSTDWQHSISFGDGGTTSASGFAGFATVSHVYTTPGSYAAATAISCTCDALVTLIRKLRNLRVDPATLDPPGVCDWPEYTDLDRAVTANCRRANQPRGCRPADSCAVLLRKAAHFRRCAAARQRLNNRCSLVVTPDTSCR